MSFFLFSVLFSYAENNVYTRELLIGKKWVAQLPTETLPNTSLVLIFTPDSLIHEVNMNGTNMTVSYEYYLSGSSADIEFKWNLVGTDTSGEYINLNRRYEKNGKIRYDHGFFKIISLNDTEMILGIQGEENQMQFIVE